MKRRFAGRSRRFRKRPRFGRRKAFVRRGRKSTGYASTSRWGRPYSNNYRGRRLSKRKWRSVIWRDTLASQHYRSIQSGLQPLTGPAIGTPNQAAVYLFPALQVTAGVFQQHHTVGSEFWISGVQPPDIGAAVPLFRGEITLRGGIARLMVGAYPENVIMRIKVYAVWANKNPDKDVYGLINNTNVQVEWDPSVVPEFSTKFGKILYQREAMVPVGESFEITHRFKPQKIDQAVYRGAPPAAGNEVAGNQLWWIVCIVPLDINGISGPVTCVNSFNLSFSADAIGTT